MKTETRPPFLMKFALFVSLFGLLTTILLMTYPPKVPADLFLRKPLIGSTFIAICAAGTAAALFPRKCSTSFDTHVPKAKSVQKSKIASPVGSKTHHPGCGRFSAHTIRFRSTSYCAACTGLVAGASLAVAMTVAYFFFGFSTAGFSLPYVMIGQLGLLVGFIQFTFKGWARLAANAFFVFGSSLIVIGIDEHIGSFFVDLYMMGLVVFWIMTRIAISQWDHSRICLICNYQCK
ncbi:MAG: hypothetical protein ABSD73_04410 [Candidatus Bathyarchaeia archaeon]|jgi:hypothetical protein